MNAESSRTCYTGKLVRLVAFDPEKATEMMARWNRSSEFQQLLDSGPAVLWPPKQMKEWLEKHLDDLYGFTVHTLEEDRVIGFVDMSIESWVSGTAWVGIGIGDPDYWGKGYGTDALRLLVGFGFGQLNLRRISLNVFGYNQRAVKSYLKCGFKEEGRLRQWMLRGGERHDLIFMGILREEWDAAQPANEPRSAALSELARSG